MFGLKPALISQQRFPSMESLAEWQAQDQYQEFIAVRGVAKVWLTAFTSEMSFRISALHLFFLQSGRELLLQPLGLYVTNERKGKFTEPNYPFGPGGEGGRDDAIYSSPANVGGALHSA